MGLEFRCVVRTADVGGLDFVMLRQDRL